MPSAFFCHSERAFGRGRIPTVSVGAELWTCYWLLFLILLRSTRDSSLRSEWHTKCVFLSFWTNFWARKNPYCGCGCEVVNMLLVIIFDSPKEYARFFTMFRMTCQVRFFVILNELLGEEESLQWVWVRSCEHVIGYYLWFTYWVREILHYVQNDMPSAFFCHSERAFWSEEESLQWVWVMSSEHFIGFYLWFA